MAPCAANVPPGEHRFEATAPEMADGSIAANVAGPTRVTTRGGSRSAKTGGLVAGIVGSGIAAIGLVGIAVEALYRSCAYDTLVNCKEDPSDVDSRHKAELAFGVVPASAR
jgi:hypothetical protein